MEAIDRMLSDFGYNKSDLLDEGNLIEL